MPIGVATHELQEKPLTVHQAIKFIGSQLSFKRSDNSRVYVGTVGSVFEGTNHHNETDIIYRVNYPPQYPEDKDLIEEEFTHNRMIQGIAHLKEYNKKKTAIENKGTAIHFD